MASATRTTKTVPVTETVNEDKIVLELSKDEAIIVKALALRVDMGGGYNPSAHWKTASAVANALERAGINVGFKRYFTGELVPVG